MNKNQNLIVLYDGSYEGLFSLIFECYRLKLNPVRIQPFDKYQPGLFDQTIAIETRIDRSERVLKALRHRISATCFKNIHCAFLSQESESELVIFQFLKKVFASCNQVEKEYTDDNVLKIYQLADKVKKESHRLKGLIRFQLTKDDIYFAPVRSDYFVIPLLVGHFKSRLADQPWVLYDVTRDKGFYYDLNQVYQMQIEHLKLDKQKRIDQKTLSDQEILFQHLWQDYFKSANIKERKNKKLQLQHMPKRYWNFLTELNQDD
ncbi:MAG: TIGR03915 family putative DNA repair protein [Candidatus Cyclobacteriaceae bacterium M3_2C_046]